MNDVHTVMMTEIDSPKHSVLSARHVTLWALRTPRTVGFVAMSSALVVFFIAAGAPTPLLPIYERQWDFAPSLITITFAAYALALIVSILVAGSLSDYVGRRPVLIGALAVELASAVVFLLSPSIAWIILARALQGFATGVASSTFAAAIVELAPERKKKLGAVMSSLATTAGLGIGTLFSGLVALAVPTAAAATVWIALTVLLAAGTVFAILTPETSSRRPGAAGSLVPRFTVPSQVRRLFAATMPSVVAVYVEVALFLGLLPTILASVFAVSQPFVGGLINFVMFTAATVASAVSGRAHAHRIKIFGDVGMTLGAIIFMGGIATGFLVLIWVATIIAGAGMGAAFSGSVRGLIPEVKPHERAGVLSSMFALAYFTMGASALLAGFVASTIGIRAMTMGFATVFAITALLGVVSSVGLFRRHQRNAKTREHSMVGAP